MAAARSFAVALVLAGSQPAARASRSEGDDAGAGEHNVTGDVSGCSSSYAVTNVSGAEVQCRSCVRARGCKWCRLEQECHARSSGYFSFFGGHTCRQLGGAAPTIKDAGGCGKRPPWANVMDSTFGPSWEADPGSAMDGLRCVQWSLGWPVSPDPSSPGAPGDEEGRWGCMSALLRHAMLVSLGVRWDGTLDDSPDAAEGGALLEGGAPEWYLDRRHVEPPLCKLIRAKFPSSKCYTRTWSVGRFRELMGIWHGGGDLAQVRRALADSIRRGPLISMVPGAGKSGSNFAETVDGFFKVKMNLKYNSAVNEPETLMELVKPVASTKPSMAEHFRENPDSLLNRPYGLLKLRMGPHYTYALLMGDAFYGMDVEARRLKDAGAPLVYTRYDLKGLSRDQTERLYEGYSLINGDFNALEKGQVHLDGHRCSRVRRAVKRDTEFLTLHNMIDYSIVMLSVRQEGPGASAPRCPALYRSPLCVRAESGEHLYTFSIIDYLNQFTSLKALESALKWGKFDHYAEGLVDYVRAICPADDEPAEDMHS